MRRLGVVALSDSWPRPPLPAPSPAANPTAAAIRRSVLSSGSTLLRARRSPTARARSSRRRCSSPPPTAGSWGRPVLVTFDEAYTPASSTYSGTFHAHPDFRPGTNAQGRNSNDLAVVVLDEPVVGITPARLPTAGLLDQMKADGSLNQATHFTAVGYGDSKFGNGPAVTPPPTSRPATTPSARSTR